MTPRGQFSMARDNRTIRDPKLLGFRCIRKTPETLIAAG
ncbi:hypothetical protein ACVI1L_004750 [Bradyrhizobium sp. USDA 4516]